MVTSWSRSQKRIALSSCEAEFLAAAGGAAEALQVKDLWIFVSRREVMIKAITDSSSCRAFTERLGVGRLKHIDIKYSWMQLEVKKETLVMESIPTLMNVSDLGTKKLSRQRREFPMYLIGIMEMNAEGKEEIFTRVGEETFSRELEKRMLAKKMKEVKKEMVQMVVLDHGSSGAKIPTNVVRAVTLLLLQQGVVGEGLQTKEGEWWTGWMIFKIACVYTLFVFAFGIYLGYRFRMKISIFFRTCSRFLRQETTMEFQREQDLQNEVGMIMRASMAAGIGEWHPDPAPRSYEPLLPRESAEEGAEELGHEATPETRMWPEDGESEPEAEGEDQIGNGNNPFGGEITCVGSWVTDWNPELGRLQEYRLLASSDDAESGEEYFISNPLGGYQRRYRPSTSERDEASPMEVDIDEQLAQSAQRADARARELAEMPYDEIPPVDADWWDYETLIAWLKPEEKPRPRKLKEAGIFPNHQLKEFLRTHLTSLYANRYYPMVFDHIMGWTQEEQRDFAAFSVAVLSSQWEDNFEERARRYVESGEV